MSIFDAIREAEEVGDEGVIEINAGMFISLVELWITCGSLMIGISDEKPEDANQAVINMAECYSKFGEKYAG